MNTQWKTKIWPLTEAGRQAKKDWIAAHSHSYRIQDIAVNNALGVTYKALLR